MKHSTLILSLLLCASGAAQACSCIRPDGAQAAAAASDRVFLGTVVSVVVECDNSQSTLQVPVLGKGEVMTCVLSTGEEVGFPTRIATLVVTDEFKGSPAVRESVSTPVYGALCGVEFEAGRNYVVYATKEGGRLVTDMCSLTGLAEDQRSGLSALRNDG